MRGRLGLWLFLTGASAWLGGCFTEVGNAKDERQVSADFNLKYAAPLIKKSATTTYVTSLRIHQFYLFVKEARYHVMDSSGALSEWFLWQENQTVMPVDFTGKDTAAMLAVQPIGTRMPINLILECQFPALAILNPDTLNFSAFHAKNYMKGTFYYGVDSLAFLFAMPSGRDVHLTYSKDSLDSWLRGNTYDCQFDFYPLKWALGESLADAAASTDPTGLKFALLDPNHNVALYQSLVAKFYQSFNAVQVTSD